MKHLTLNNMNEIIEDVEKKYEWHVSKDENNSWNTWIADDNGNIARICNGIKPDSQIYRIASVMSAAPDLLEVCKEAMQSDIDGSFVNASKWWEQMKKAIEKAEQR